MFITRSNRGKVSPPRTEPAPTAFTFRATVGLDRDDRELADPARRHPVAPEPMRRQQVVECAVAELAPRSRTARPGRRRSGRRRPAGASGCTPGSSRPPVRHWTAGRPARSAVSARPCPRRASPLFCLGEGWPSSTVKANRPPARRAAETSRSSGSLSRNASMVSSSRTTSNGPLGTGGTRRPRTDRRVRRPARSLASSIGAGIQVDAEVAATELRRDEPPGAGHTTAEVQHRDARSDPARRARDRISPARMKLSCPTYSPGGYAATRAARRARS